MDLLLALPSWLAWLAIVAGALFVWGGYRHYRKIHEIPRFNGITSTFWATVYGMLVQGVLLVALGVWRLAAAA